MNDRSRPSRRPFLDYHDYVVQQLLDLGITRQQIEALREYGLFACDTVTGYHEGRSGKGRSFTLRQAIQHTKETGEEAFYVEFDLRNLSGLNAALGHSKTNEVFAAIAAIVRKELAAVASDSSFYRHGGDEMSAFLIDATDHGIRAAFEHVHAAVARLAREYHAQEIPHPKHRDDARYSGTGVHFGLCKILGTDESDPTRVFQVVDKEVQLSKEAGGATDCPCATGTRSDSDHSATLVARGKLTHESLKSMLVSLGCEPVETKADDGSPIFSCFIRRDGLRHLIKIQLSTDGTLLWFSSPLQVLEEPENVSSVCLLRLLQANDEIGPMFFSYNPNNKRLYLCAGVANETPIGASFRKEFDSFSSAVEQTLPLWAAQASPSIS
jgi:GGDEF domain-containing protein